MKISFKKPTKEDLALFEKTVADRLSRFIAFGGGDAVVVLIDEKPIGVWGMDFISTGYGECYLELLPEGRKYPKTVVRVSKFILDRGFTHHKLRRLQTVMENNPLLLKWVKLMGFQFEGILRKFKEDGTECHLYSRVK